MAITPQELVDAANDCYVAIDRSCHPNGDERLEELETALSIARHEASAYNEGGESDLDREAIALFALGYALQSWAEQLAGGVEGGETIGVLPG